MSESFDQKLWRAAETNQSLLCVGLDVDPRRMPVKSVVEFNKAIIDATKDLVCAYKPNLAFYEALGIKGLRALETTIKAIPPNIPVIADAKRSDIGTTAERYADALFKIWGFDAATVSPYLGSDAVAPFLEFDQKGVFLLCRTSNAGARDFQDLIVRENDWEGPLFEWTAHWAMGLESRASVGFVVGATYPDDMARLRDLFSLPTFLIPGIGAQGGSLLEAVQLGSDARGRGIVINASRQVLYSSNDPLDYPKAARSVAAKLRQEIATALDKLGKPFSGNEM